MSPKVLVGLVVLSMGVVVALIGGLLREGLNAPGGAEETGTPATSTTQPVNAQAPKAAPSPAAPAPAPAPAPAAPAQLPAPAPAPAPGPQTQQYVAPAAPP